MNLNDLRAHIDIESFSKIDLKKSGVFRYAEDSSTEVLCLSYAFGKDKPKLWHPGLGPLPDELVTFVRNGGQCAAHNAGFELTMLNGPAGQKIGFPKTKPQQWVDTAAKAAAHALPRDLGGCAKALRLISKDDAGKAVMLKLSRPRKPTKADPSPRYTPQAYPELFETLYNYCANDVAVEQAIDHRLPDLVPEEQSGWVLDYVINSRGLEIDQEAVALVRKMAADYKEILERECQEITGGFKSSQRDRIMEWCEAQGYKLTGYTAEAIRDMLKADKDTMPPQVKRILEIRKDCSRTSIKKYDALANAVGLDGRLRGMFLFHGAGTGRWAGRIVQLHNLPRGNVKDTIEAVEQILFGDMKWLQVLYPNLMDLFSSTIRSIIRAKDGHELLVCDFSSIEARVLGWVANDPLYQKAFREGLDLYIVMASVLYNEKYEDIAEGVEAGVKKYKDMRQFGKMCILGLGYQMGKSKFKDTCEKMGVFVSDELIEKGVNSYRSTYKRIKLLWNELNEAAIQAVKNPGAVFIAGRCKVSVRGEFLYIKLPSGRKLAYNKPRIMGQPAPWDPEQLLDQVTFMGENSTTKKWERQSTYGGKLVENIVQAIARDLLLFSMKQLELERHTVIGHVHDEVIAEVPIGFSSVKKMEEIMVRTPAWAKGCYVGAEGFASSRYRK